MQYAMFPMKVLRVTQGYGYAVDGVQAYTFSHAKEYALDLGGTDGGQDWLYAPFDMKCRRIYGNYNACWFESLEPVMCADGQTRRLVIECIHMNNADKSALGLYVGKVILQGQKFYREGTAGYATGNHVHMEIGLGPFRNVGWHAEWTGTKNQWVIDNKLIPSKILFLGKDVQVKNAVYKWTYLNSSNPAPAPSLSFTSLTNKVITTYTSNVEYFDTTSVKNPLGKLPIGGSYPCNGKSNGKAEGYEWARFIYNGKTYYTALVSDNRVKIENAMTSPDNNVSSGLKVKINATLYASSTAKTGRKVNGDYWIYDGVNYNGRYRVTNSPDNVGKNPVGTYVSGYVDASVVLPQDTNTYKSGDRVFVSGTLFASSNGNSGSYKQGNYYWIYDGVNYNGRYRVTNSPDNVGKAPLVKYVSGYVSTSAMRKA